MWKYWTRILADHSKERRELKYAESEMSVSWRLFLKEERETENGKMP